MKEIYVSPGDVVVTNIGLYQHFSVVSDLICALGKPMLISATDRNGTVQEETWGVVTQGKETYVADIPTTLSVAQILANARSQIGKWKYSLIKSKCCEDFA